MNIKIVHSIFISFILIPIISLSQKDYVYTKEFSQKLDKFGLTFYEPTENWLHPIPYDGDQFARYDMVFVSEDDSLEIRYIFQPLDNPMALSNTPHIEFVRLISNLATNRQTEDIVVRGIDPVDLREKYHADWGLISDFIPKKSLTKKSRGKALVIFNERYGLVFSLLFYNNQKAPQFFELPISFKSS